MDIKNLKCKNCGAPLKPMGGEAIVTCEYCGGCVALSGAGWKMVQTHTMLVPQIVDQNQAIAACQGWMNKGLFHHRDFESAKIAEVKCSVVPYWIVPASAVTHYTYEDVAVDAAKMGGSIAAGALLGAAFSGGGRRVAVVPVYGGGGSKRAGELAGQFQFPVIAVKGLEVYQPRSYQFDITARLPFDKRKLPPGLQILNGDVSEDDAKFMAKNYVTQLQADRAKQQHKMVESLKTEVNVSDGELMHVPVWYIKFALKNGKTETIVIDAQRNAVMNAQKPA
jgi:hypothetical protein